MRFHILKSHFTFCAFLRRRTTFRMLPMVAFHRCQMLLRRPLRNNSSSSLLCRRNCSSSSFSSLTSLSRLFPVPSWSSPSLASSAASLVVFSLGFLGFAKLLSERKVQLSSSPLDVLVDGGRIRRVGVKLRWSRRRSRDRCGRSSSSVSSSGSNSGSSISGSNEDAAATGKSAGSEAAVPRCRLG